MEHRQEATCEILVSSDIHGHIYPTDYRPTGECQLGLAKLATLIGRERQVEPDLLLLDNGDLIQATPLSTYFVKNKQGIHPMIEVLNRLGYDAGVPGNHEFNYGLSTLCQVVEDSKLTGKDIRAALEQTAIYWQLGSDGELMINPSFLEPKAQHYNYDMWEGIEYELDISRPSGERVVS